jgi:hypothetical protein
MGGNVTINGFSAAPLDIQKLGGQCAVVMVSELLNGISCNYVRKLHSDLWVDGNWERHLSGSSAHLFSSDISWAELEKYKPVFGDIDVQIDRHKCENLLFSLSTISLPNASYLGAKQSGNTVVTLWNMHSLNGLNLQIDFELVDFNDGAATSWCKMMYSSSWEDVKAGFKGVAHKFLLRALNAVDLEDRDVEMQRGDIKRIKSSEYAISARGLRRKLCRSADGAYWKELPSKGAVYDTDPCAIFRHYFRFPPTQEDLNKFSSFVGLCDLITHHFDVPTKKKIYNGFVHSLTNDKAQNFCKDLVQSNLMKIRMMRAASLFFLLSDDN